MMTPFVIPCGPSSGIIFHENMSHDLIHYLKGDYSPNYPVPARLTAVYISSWTTIVWSDWKVVIRQDKD